MENNSNESHSKELLKMEANMSAIPGCLLLKQKIQAEKISTFRPPPSSVLQQARNFLPLMAKANEDMMNKMHTLPPGAFDIEDIDENGSHIEMNLALVERDDSDSSVSSDYSELSDLETSENDEENSEEMSDCHCASSLSNKNTQSSQLSPVDEYNIKLPGHTTGSKKQPTIKVLSHISEPNDVSQANEVISVQNGTT